jgi:hypothetical protein
MSQKPEEPVENPSQSEDDTEGHNIAAAIGLSGMMSPRSREQQWAKEDALPLDPPAGRARSKDDKGTSSKGTK